MGDKPLICVNPICAKALAGSVPFCPYCGTQQVGRDDLCVITKSESSKPETPKSETPKSETPKPETPKPETPKPETPKPETPKPVKLAPKHPNWIWSVALLVAAIVGWWNIKTPSDHSPTTPTTKVANRELPSSSGKRPLSAGTPVAPSTLPQTVASEPTNIPTPETPVREASAKTPDIRVGDRWLLQTLDHTNPQWNNSTERVVTEVNDSGMTVTSRNTKSNYTRTLAFTREWSLLTEREPSGKSAEYSPPLQYLSFPLERGKTWHREILKRKSDTSSDRVYNISAEVHDWEHVEVPAGTFEAIKVVLQIETRENGALLTRSTDTSWYSPVVKRSVKTDEVLQDITTGQEARRSIVLVNYSVSR
jgi:hypothetical protein